MADVATMTPPAPAMIDIAAADAPIGTPFADLDGLLADYRGLGVKIDWLRKESPRFHLRLQRYRIAERPVSGSDFAYFLHHTDRRRAITTPGGEADRGEHPARISHEDALAYTAWIARETGHAFRLPTEFEWEFAAAGAHGNAFPWGPRYRDGIANTAEAGHGDTRPIGEQAGNVSWCGALDMAGNVEEWTSSFYRPYPGGTPVVDAFNPDGEDYVVTRGGSYRQSRDCARCQRRHGVFADSAVGLRLAETV